MGRGAEADQDLAAEKWLAELGIDNKTAKNPKISNRESKVSITKRNYQWAITLKMTTHKMMVIGLLSNGRVVLKSCPSRLLRNRIRGLMAARTKSYWRI